MSECGSPRNDGNEKRGGEEVKEYVLGKVQGIGMLGLLKAVTGD